MLAELHRAAFQYYGVDWLIAVLVFLGLFGIEEHRRNGFLFGAASAALGIFFSLQIHSIANLVTSVILVLLYTRGYITFGKAKDASRMNTKHNETQQKNMAVPVAV